MKEITLVSCVIFVGACSASTPSINKGDRQAIADTATKRFLGYDRFPIADVSPSGQRVKVLTLRIGSDLNVRRLVRSIKKANSNSDGDPSGTETDDTQPTLTGSRTRWDMDFRSYLRSATQYGVIRIIVRPPVRFMPDPHAITAGDQAGTEIFYGKEIIRSDPNRQVAKVYVRWTPTGLEGSLNIGLIVSDAEDKTIELPIFIDPKIRNNG